MISRLLLCSILLTAAAGNTSASALSDRWDALYGDEITFDVYRKGRKVGAYSTTFKARDNLLSVDIAMQLEIPILFGWTYDYSYKARELWQNENMISLDVSVNDNGDVKTLSAENVRQKLMVIQQDEKKIIDLPLLPTHHYNADVLDDTRVFNTLTGSENTVVITREGEDTLVFDSQTIETEKFRYSGDLNDTIVWYDSDNRWVKMVFPGTDGALIELRCTSCTR